MKLPTPPSALLVKDQSQLSSLCERWLDCQQIALDTEFIRTRTFFPKLGLVQVADPEGVYLLDAMALEDWQPLLEVLTSSSVVKVLHSPSEDLELFRHAFDVLPEPIVDTQIACTLAGLAEMPGYARMILGLFDVDLPKGEQRSDWLRRPLSAEQVLYAGLDVAYLLPAWEILESSLEKQDRVGWFVEEMARIVAQSAAKNEPETIYRRLARVNLDPQQAGILYDLVAWREGQARCRDLPRKFVVGDNVLLDLAKQQPTSTAALESIAGLGAGQRKRLGERLLQIVRSATERDLTSERIDHAKVSKASLLRVRKCFGEIAEELKIPLTFLASKRAMEKYIRRASRPGNSDIPAELEGWRWRQCSDRLQSVIDSPSRS